MSKFTSLLDLCEAAGYDAGRNKPDIENCHFGLFATPEQTRAWERGNKRGYAEREATSPSGGHLPTNERSADAE
jgi:hypothetical protein